MRAGGWQRGALAALVGCGPSAPPEVPEPTPEEALARIEELAAQPATGASGAPGTAPAQQAVTGAAAPELVFVWHGIGPLYQSFFTHEDVIADLQAQLTGWVRGPANVHIYYDQQKFVGDIRLQVLPETLLQPVQIDGAAVRLVELAPLTTALATYRDAVSGRFDVRVASFRVGVESFQGPRHCLFGVAGPPPPDGRTISPCVTLNGQQRCGEPQADGSVQFGASLARDVRECLNPKG